MIPYVIQYLEAASRADGSQLFQPGVIQLLMPSVPPMTQVPYAFRPMEGYYAYIAYRLAWDPTIIPNAWNLTVTQWGAQTYTGVLSADILRDGIELIMVTTVAQPSYVTVTNLTPLSQYGCAISYFVTIRSGDDYVIAMDLLKYLGTKEAARLLAAMVYAQQPKPPEGG